MYNVKNSARDKASESNVEEGRGTRISFFAVPPKKVKKGTTTRNEGCRPDGTRSPSRCRASCCNAKLKQNYLVPLPSTVHGMGTESPRRWGWLSPPGRRSFLPGVHFNASKKRLLKAIFSSEEKPGDGRIFVCTVCADMREPGTGCFVCRRAAEGQEFIDLRPGRMHIDLCNSEITRSLSREGGKVH